MALVSKTWFEQQQSILLAVILQDMKTRFGSGYASYLIAILWPLTHIAVISTGYLIINHFAPIGSDPAVFVGTAAIPYIICLYPVRIISTAILLNRPFLNYNIILPAHLILARIILEFLNVGVVVLLIIAAGFIAGVEIMPLSISDAASAIGASLFLGISFGFFSAIVVAVIGNFAAVFVVLFMVGLYVGSLALIPDYLISSNVREYLDYNPVYCVIKWLRVAYFPVYGLYKTSHFFVITVSFLFLFLGLLGERFLRGRIIR